MPRGRPFQPGQSGNPAGRPPKSRALTAILERAGSHTVEVDGKPVSGKRLLGQLLWQIITEGKARLPGGQELIISPRDWFEVAKFIYGQVDGPPAQTLRHTGDEDGPLRIEHGLSQRILEDEETNRLAHALVWRTLGDASGDGAPVDEQTLAPGKASSDA